MPGPLPVEATSDGLLDLAVRLRNGRHVGFVLDRQGGRSEVREADPVGLVGQLERELQIASEGVQSHSSTTISRADLTTSICESRAL
jgi:hypothetical protein